MYDGIGVGWWLRPSWHGRRAHRVSACQARRWRAEYCRAERVPAGCTVATFELGEGLTCDAPGGATGDVSQDPGMGSFLIAHTRGGGLRLVVVRTLINLLEGGNGRQHDPRTEPTGEEHHGARSP